MSKQKISGVPLEERVEKIERRLDALEEEASCAILAQPADEFSRQVVEHLKEYVQRQQ